MEKFLIENIEVNEIDKVAGYLATKSVGIYDEKSWLKILNRIWVANPFMEPGKILGWKIIDSQRTIRGILGNIPVQCMVYGKLQDSFWATSWFVDKEARSQSLPLFMLYVKQGGLLMSNTPNENVENLLIRLLKYKRADSPWFKGAYILPVKPVKDFFSAGNPSAVSARRIGMLFSATLLKLPQAISVLRMGSGNLFNSISVKRVYDFSEATDRWFSDFASFHVCTLVRSAKMYQWLLNDPFISVFELTYDNCIQGYLVCKNKRNKDFSYIELMDEAILPLPEKIQKAIIRKACCVIIETAKRESVLVMRSNSEPVRQSLRKMFSIPVKRVEKCYYKENYLQNGETPFLTSLDGDGVFF